MKFAFIITLLLSSSVYGQTPFDGPYVRYQNGRILVSTIDRDDDLLLPKTVSYTDRNAITLVIRPENHSEWGFVVKLRDTLTNAPVTYSRTDKILFISDMEGEFANFRKLLIAAKVIDERYNWTYGNGALVIPGDLFDRGKDVVPELWLLYKLEDEARAAGGHTIVIDGNHDVMALSGDHRYTEGKYFKDAWFLKQNIDDLFGKDTELGRWLRTKNVIAKIGDVLTMHGGMSPVILNQRLTLEQLNAVCQRYIDQPRSVLHSSDQVFFGKDALFWYRGYFMQPRATMGLIDSTLKQYDCKYIVVGHTIVKWNIASYYNGKVIGIDVNEHQNQTDAALYDSGKWFVIDEKGNSKPLVYKYTNDLITENDIL